MKMTKWSSQWAQFIQLRKEAWKKIQDFNGVWTRDLAISGAMLYQLSYEATDVKSTLISIRQTDVYRLMIRTQSKG